DANARWQARQWISTWHPSSVWTTSCATPAPNAAIRRSAEARTHRARRIRNIDAPRLAFCAGRRQGPRLSALVPPVVLGFPSSFSMSSFVRPDLAGSQPLRDTAHDPKRSWRTWLFGRPLSTADAEHEAIGKTVGLAVFASDALSSTAYATQEILIILAAAGAAAFAYSFPIAIGLVFLTRALARLH